MIPRSALGSIDPQSIRTWYSYENWKIYVPTQTIVTRISNVLISDNFIRGRQPSKVMLCLIWYNAQERLMRFKNTASDVITKRLITMFLGRFTVEPNLPVCVRRKMIWAIWSSITKWTRTRSFYFELINLRFLVYFLPHSPTEEQSSLLVQQNDPTIQNENNKNTKRCIVH